MVVLIAAAAVLMSNLDGQYLWQDEAQTALIAGTVLTHGIPLGHDGKNSFSQEAGLDYDENHVWRWHPWLSFYVLAGFFAVLGKSTLVARLPFALFGVATIGLAYWFGKELWGSRRAGLLAATALCVNVPFLVLARQCRYYAPNMFFALLALYGYWNLTQRRKYSTATFIVSAVLLFHTHYVHYAALIAAVFIHALVFHRDRLKVVLIASAISVLAVTPWIVWFSGMGRFVQGNSDTGMRALTLAGLFILQVWQYIFPPLLLLLPAAIWVTKRLVGKNEAKPDAGAWDRLALLLIFAVVTVAAASMTATYQFLRYIAPVIPVSCLAIGLILNSVSRLHKVAGAVAVVAVLVALGYAWRMPDYYHEITHKYVGPVDGIVEYLNEHARKSDIVAITYEDLPIKFYTGLRVIGGLTGEDLNPARKADWVIIRQYQITERDKAVTDFLTANLPLMKAYRLITVPSPDIPFQNREDPAKHLFRTATDHRVIIFQKTATAGANTSD